MLEVTVKRSEWGRGDNWQFGCDSALCRPYDNSRTKEQGVQRCCLGFMCNVMGLTDEEITGHTFPHLLSPEKRKKITIKIGSDEYWKVGDINDETGIYDTEREAEIIKWGRQNSIDFTFVD